MIFHTQQVWFSSNTAQEMGAAVAINDNNDNMLVNISGNLLTTLQEKVVEACLC